MALRHAVFPIFDFKKCRDIEIWFRCHSRSMKVVPFNRFVVYRNFISKMHLFEIFDFKNAVTLKTELGSLKVMGNVTIR